MREKQRIADLKKQGIDPDADKDEPKKKTYDTSFLKQYEVFEDEDEEETKDGHEPVAEFDDTEETKEAPATKT